MQWQATVGGSKGKRYGLHGNRTGARMNTSGSDSRNDAAELDRFLQVLFAPSDLVEIRVIETYDEQDRKRSRQLHRDWLARDQVFAQFDKLSQWTRAPRFGNIFFGVCPRPQRGMGKKADIAVVRTLWTDIDDCSTDEALERISRARLPRPSLVLNSGHGSHCYWVLDHPFAISSASDRQRIERLNAALGRMIGGDHTQDLSRVLRLPGFDNVKNARNGAHPTACRIAHCDDAKHSLAQIESLLPIAASDAGTAQLKSTERASPMSPALREWAMTELGKPSDDRSKRDYVVLCELHAKGVGAEEAWECVRSHSKFRDRGRSYFDTTWKAAAFNYPSENDLNWDIRTTATQRIDDENRNAHAALEHWPDPPAEAAYYGLGGRIVRLIEPHTEADPAAILVQLHVAFGNVVGRGPHFRVEGDRHFTNMNATLVGATAKGRKGTSAGRVFALLSSIDNDWCRNRVISGGLSSGEGLIWAVRDPILKREPVRAGNKQTGRVIDYEDVQIDAGELDKRLLVVESEFGGVLKVLAREGNTLSPVLRRAWDGADVLKTITKNSPAKATGAHISIIGHITRDELRRNLDDTEILNGLGNRFLWVAVRRSKCLPEGGGAIAGVERLIEELGAATAFARSLCEVRRDADARALWHKVYPQLSEGRPGLLGAAISRAEAQVMRLALIYALLDQCREIRRPHLEAALALWEYCERSAAYIFGDAIGDPTADAILAGLRQDPEGLDRAQIHQLFGRHRKANQIDRALGVLLQMGKARITREETNGRPRERWFATPVGSAWNGGGSLRPDLNSHISLNSPPVSGAQHTAVRDFAAAADSNDAALISLNSLNSQGAGSPTQVTVPGSEGLAATAVSSSRMSMGAVGDALGCEESELSEISSGRPDGEAGEEQSESEGDVEWTG